MSLFIIIASFLGGIVGALVGSVQACMLAGFIGIFMHCFPETPLLSELLSASFIPFISFGGGVAATAFASKIRKHQIGGSDIARSLAFSGDTLVLLVSGLFGVFGAVFAWGIGKIGVEGDGGALSLIASAIIIRLAFGDGVLINKDIKNISKYKDGKKEWIFIIFFGACIGFMAGWLADKSGAAFLPFFISLASLVFFFIDESFLASHHITIIAGYAYLVTGNVVWATVWGLIASIVCTIVGDLFNANESSHFDPPATTIGILSVIIYLIF